MACPECGSHQIRKNGKMRGPQTHICVDCGGQFIDVYTPPPVTQRRCQRYVALLNSNMIS